MLRYRATEIRLTSQDVDDSSKRLAARRTAANNASSTICQLPGSTSTGPRLRRGPERSRDESITHPDACHAAQLSAALESAVGTAGKDNHVPQRPGRQQRQSCSSYLLPNSSPADDFSYTSEPELARRPNPLAHVDQRVSKRASLSPKKHDRGAAKFDRQLLQLDGSSDSTANNSASPGKAQDADRFHRSLTPTTSKQQLQDPSARFAVEKAPRPRASLHQSRSSDPLLQVESQGDQGLPISDSAFNGYIATSTGTHRGLPVWYNSKNIKRRPRDSVIEGTFNMVEMSEALKRPEEAIPSIRLDSPTSTRSSADSDKKHHSLPTLSNLSPLRPVSRSPSVSQASDHSSRNLSRPPSLHLRTASTPDLLRPLLGPLSMSPTSSRHTSSAVSADNSPTSSIAMLELIRQNSSPLERLEQETRSQISRAPPARLSSVGTATSRLPSPTLGELRMPTFESPEQLSPHHRRAARYRNAPTFVEVPNAPFSSSFDLLPSFEYSPPSLQPGTFIDRYPGSVTASRRRGSGTDQGATSMPSLPASHPSRRRTSGPGHAPVQVARTTHLSTHHWPRGRGGGEGVMESRRNTVGGQQRLRRYRSISARMLPSWQDEQENSGRAERMAVMAEMQERRRYVEQTNDGRLDRTPPSLGRFESTLFQN